MVHKDEPFGLFNLVFILGQETDYNSPNKHLPLVTVTRVVELYSLNLAPLYKGSVFTVLTGLWLYAVKDCLQNLPWWCLSCLQILCEPLFTVYTSLWVNTVELFTV